MSEIYKENLQSESHADSLCFLHLLEYSAIIESRFVRHCLGTAEKLLLFSRPIPALVDAVAFAVRQRVVGELVQLLAGKFGAEAAVFQPLAFAAILDGAALAPVGLFHLRAAGAFHDVPVFAFAAFHAAAGFVLFLPWQTNGGRAGIKHLQRIAA